MDDDKLNEYLIKVISSYFGVPQKGIDISLGRDEYERVVEFS